MKSSRCGFSGTSGPGGCGVLMMYLELLSPLQRQIFSNWFWQEREFENKSFTRTNATASAYIKLAVRGTLNKLPEFAKARRLIIMATYRDPVRCFAPLEVIE